MNSLIIRTTVISSMMVTLSFGCGCIDAPLATTAASLMNGNYHMADAALSSSLTALGQTVNNSYLSMSNGAMDVEKIGRLKREQAIVLKKIVFIAERNNKHISLHNVLSAKGVEGDLSKAEKNAVLKSMLLNQNNPYQE